MDKVKKSADDDDNNKTLRVFFHKDITRSKGKYYEK